MTPGYETLIDAETWAFIRRTEAQYPPDAANRPIAEQRRIYDAMCRAFLAPHPPGLTVRDDHVAGRIPVRKYRRTGPPAARVLYFHGGGFVVGGLDSHDDVCAEICHQTDFEVISVDYRLSPEHGFPADFEDALTAHGALFDGSPVILAGDSAGGALAAAVSAASRRTGVAPVGQVLIYPGLGGALSLPSYTTHADAPMLTRADVEVYGAIRTGGKTELANDPRCRPLQDVDFADLPPTMVFSAQCDPLASDGETYVSAIEAAGGKALWVEEPGLVHGYLRARHSVARARASFARIVAAISGLGTGVWPPTRPLP